MEKKVLITGSGSYIGESVKAYLKKNSSYLVDIIETRNFNPKIKDFEKYDVVINVAGVAHVKETKQNRNLYYKVNRNLAVKIARTAKLAGVHQYILLSSMSVYGVTEGYITKDTIPNPVSAYGKSKLQADELIAKLDDSTFKFACLRPPMVYGEGCKGNYQLLRKFALKSPVFPDFKNQRSMININGLCKFIHGVIEKEESGLFFPQDKHYVCTSEMVEGIAKDNNKKIYMTKIFNPFIRMIRISVIKKVFGNLIYEKVDMV